jgi:hypothetical protein
MSLCEGMFSLDWLIAHPGSPNEAKYVKQKEKLHTLKYRGPINEEEGI